MDSFNSINTPAGHTDIVRNGWIFRALPSALHPYAVLMRLDRPIGIWLLLLPGWWAIAASSGGITGLGVWGFYLLFLFGIGSVLMRGAGCIINDLWDRDLDRQVERTRNRPLASGELSKGRALAFLALLLWAGLMILVQLPSPAIFTGFAAMVLVVLYPLAKRVTWYPQAVLGLTFNMGALMGWASVTGHIGTGAWLLYLAGIFWTLGYDTIYAHQDTRDDAIVGVKSTARKFGKNSPKYVAGFYALATLLIFVAGVLLSNGAAFYALWGVGSLLMIAQLWRWNKDDPASCLAAFRASRIYGMIIFAAFLLGFVI